MQGERQPSWGMMGRWAEEVGLTPSDWRFIFPYCLLPACSPQVRLPDLSNHLAGFLQRLQGERRGVGLPSGTRRCHYLQLIVCFFLFCTKQLLLMLSCGMFVSFGLIKVFLLFCLQKSLENYVVSSKHVEILHGTSLFCPNAFHTNWSIF